jgi:hypothetical protein
MSIPDGTKPDLIFYYSLSLESSIINTNVVVTDTTQTVYGIIFADKKLKNPIGNFAFNITIFETIEEKESFLYNGTGTNVYFLPEGTISNSINLKFKKSPKGIYFVPESSNEVYQILSGSGDFLNSRGFIVQNTNNFDITRDILVYFEK